jgi:two-component sensor histidine kinase
LEQSRIIVAQKQTIIEQKQAMMSELHHRIKNNLQVLSSLLEMQQSRINDPATGELMKAIDQRLNAMLLIHQGLYGDHISSDVNMQDYIDALVQNLCLSFGYSAGKLNIRKRIEPLRLNADKALSLGFICNEVISNWFKHVLRHDNEAELNIELSSRVLRFTDNGPGGLAESSQVSGASFGVRLIQLFSQELNSKLLLHSDNSGTTITLHLSHA